MSFPARCGRGSPSSRGLALLLALAAGAASADVTIEETLAIEGEGLMRLASMSGRSVNTYAADRARMESDLQMKSRLARMVARGLGPTAQIVRLDQDKVYELDLERKRYVETSLAEHRARMQQAMVQARAAQDEQSGAAGGADVSQCEWGAPRADVRRDGATATIAGHAAEHVVIDARQSCTDRATGQVCEYALTLDQWLAPGVRAGEQVMQFQKAYATRMGFAAPMSEGAAQRAEGQFGRYGQIWKEVGAKLGEMPGYPLRSRFTLALGGPQCGGGAAGSGGNDGEAARPGNPPLAGIAGRLGGLLQRQRGDGANADAPSGQAPPGGGPGHGFVRLLTLSTEVTAIRDEPAAPGAFEIPAGFQAAPAP